MNPNKKNEFDRRLAGKFENFRPEVPGGLWEKLASKLDEQEQTNIVPIKQRHRFPTKWVSVAAAVLMVCGAVYWYNRPITITYLRGPVVHNDETVPPVEEAQAPIPVPEVEPLDIHGLKQLFARRSRNVKNEHRSAAQVAETQVAQQPAETIESQPLASEREEIPLSSLEQVLANNDESAILPAAHPAVENTVAATVPEIEPPVVLEEEEETLLAATDKRKQPFGVSNILNYVVNAVDQRDEKLVTFSDDGEGSLKLDFNFGLAKNRKNSIK